MHTHKSKVIIQKMHNHSTENWYRNTLITLNLAIIPRTTCNNSAHNKVAPKKLIILIKHKNTKLWPHTLHKHYTLKYTPIARIKSTYMDRINNYTYKMRSHMLKYTVIIHVKCTTFTHQIRNNHTKKTHVNFTHLMQEIDIHNIPH